MSRGRGERLRALILPHSAGGNPYLELLAGGLREAGVEVGLHEGRPSFALLRAVLRHGLPDVVHLQWHHRYFRSGTAFGARKRTVLFFAQVAALRRLGVRFVWTVHNVVHHRKDQVERELAACRRLARRVDALVAHCPTAAGQVAAAYRIPAERVRVVPHGAYPGPAADVPGREEARRRAGLPPDGTVFLFFGWVREYKGLDRLLDDFAALEDPRARLILAGRPVPAELGTELARRASRDPRVWTRFEFVPDDELAGLLRAADAVVLPYADTLTSGAAVMAASHGRPVVAPRLGCLCDFPREATFLYDPEAADGLRRALEEAAASRLERAGEAARAWVEAFGWGEVGRRTAEVYRSVVEGAGLPGNGPEGTPERGQDPTPGPVAEDARRTAGVAAGGAG